MTGLCTSQEAAAWLNLTDGTDDNIVANVVYAASDAVRVFCGRQFTPDTDATARTYVADTSTCVDDFWDAATAIVAVDNGQDGTFEQTLTVSTQYIFEPVNSVVDGIAGYPYTRIRLMAGYLFPSAVYGRPQLQLTAKWGWKAVPAPVKQATLQVVGELWKRKDAPFGVLGGQEFGTIFLSPDAMRSVSALLRGYRKGSAVAAMA